MTAGTLGIAGLVESGEYFASRNRINAATFLFGSRCRGECRTAPPTIRVVVMNHRQGYPAGIRVVPPSAGRHSPGANNRSEALRTTTRHLVSRFRRSDSLLARSRTPAEALLHGLQGHAINQLHFGWADGSAGRFWLFHWNTYQRGVSWAGSEPDRTAERLTPCPVLCPLIMRPLQMEFNPFLRLFDDWRPA